MLEYTAGLDRWFLDQNRVQSGAWQRFAGGGRQFLTERVDQLGVQADVLRRTTERQVEGVGINHPLIGFNVEVGQRAVIELNGHALAFARLEEHFLVAFEFLDRTLDFRVLLAHVQLSDFRTANLAGVGQIEGHLDRRIAHRNARRHFDVAVTERGVRQAVTERVERLDAFLLVTAITQHQVILVIHVGQSVLIVEFREGSVSRVVFDVAFDTDRQLARRVDLAEQDLGQSLTTVLTRVEGMQRYRNLFDPVAHLQTRTAIHGHHGVRVDLGDVLDQLVLELRQIEAVVETFTFVFVAVTHGNHNGVIAGQVLRSVQRSRTQLHTYQATHGRQVTGATRVLELHIVRLASFQIDLGELWNGRRDAVARQWLAVTVVDDFLAVDPQTHGAVGTNLEHLLAALGRGDLAGVANRSRRCIAIQFASGRTFAGVRIGRRSVAFERQVLVVGPVQVNMLLGTGDRCITRPVGVAEVLDFHALDFIASCVGGGPGTGAWVQRQAFDEVDFGVGRDLLQTAQFADVMAGQDEERQLASCDACCTLFLARSLSDFCLLQNSLLFSVELTTMKFSVISAGVVLGLALSGAVVAAEATDDDATSGASDSTVMTQTQDAKAAQKAQKQKTETTKGGRPQNATPQKQSN
ncbi:hypothetical protein ALP82_05137 [Pseudomonas savastanoi pv. fraxini]|nr:hypothetical protein ALQ90_04751 [Pseudomonas savastanoi pv. savastanoi]RMR62130.1 hypothetical protein ALP82_05137 [Pseudomonas savastanoi pv. fraxini]